MLNLLRKLLKIPKIVSSPNFSSRKGTKITHIVIHVTEGNAPGCISWLCNPKSIASAHYIIKKNGEVVQLVKEENKAWHAMNANPFSVGIEHEGFSDTEKITLPQYQASIKLAISLCKKYNIPPANILGHNDPWLRQFGNNHHDPGTYLSMSIYREDVKAALK